MVLRELGESPEDLGVALAYRLRSKRQHPLDEALGPLRERRPVVGAAREMPDAGLPESISFDWRFSLRSARKEQMLKDLLYYRLALGQPDPEAFLEMLKRVGDEGEDARSLAIDLSAISRFARIAP